MAASSTGPAGMPGRRSVPAPILMAGSVVVAAVTTQASGAPESDTYLAAFIAVGGLGLLLSVTGAWRQRSRIGAVAPLLMAAIGCTYVGDVDYIMNAALLGREPFPSWTDVLFLGTDALLMAAALLVIRRQGVGRDTGALLDALIVTVGFAVLSWSSVIADVARDSSATAAERIVGTLYPVSDVLVVGVLMRLLVSAGDRRGPVVYLAGGMISLLIGDIGFTFAVFVGGGHVPTRLQDSCYLLFYLLVGLTLWHPQANRLTLRGETRSERIGPARMSALTVGAMLAPVTLLVENLTGRTEHVRAASVGGILLFGLALSRMWLLVRAVESHREQLTLQARTDSLTGLPNRRTFDFQLDRAMTWAHPAEGPSTPLAVAILDLDHFKNYNDSHGHGAGDQLLRECAAQWLDVLDQIPRTAELGWHQNGTPTNFLARYGGEEFALLFPGLGAEVAAEVLRQALLVTPAGQTFSAGVAEWDGKLGPLELLNRADSLLYEAKAAGRARIFSDRPEQAHVEQAAGHTALRTVP